MAETGSLTFSEQHHNAMTVALEQARIAVSEGEVPVGAVVLNAEGKIVARAHNMTRSGDPTAHAEVLAIRQAAAAGGSARSTLEDHTLVVTLEPCSMCAGAILASRIHTVVFGSWDDKAGAAGSVFDLLRDRRLPHRCEVVAGLMADQSAKILAEFFEERR